MVFITAEDHKNAGVHTITIKNKHSFWVTVKEVQDGLGLDSLTKQMQGIFQTKKLTKEQKTNLHKL